MAVVLRHRIAAAVVDAARHHAIVELVRRIERDVIAHHVLAAHAQQAFGDHRTVADPRSPVGTRARLQARADARDQHVRGRGTQRVDQRLALLRHLDVDAIEPVAPILGRGLL
jgi:hypothetical protein